jgi:hypothetical protein
MRHQGVGLLFNYPEGVPSTFIRRRIGFTFMDSGDCSPLGYTQMASSHLRCPLLQPVDKKPTLPPAVHGKPQQQCGSGFARRKPARSVRPRPNTTARGPVQPAAPPAPRVRSPLAVKGPPAQPTIIDPTRLGANLAEFAKGQIKTLLRWTSAPAWQLIEAVRRVQLKVPMDGFSLGLNRSSYVCAMQVGDPCSSLDACWQCKGSCRLEACTNTVGSEPPVSRSLR